MDSISSQFLSKFSTNPKIVSPKYPLQYSLLLTISSVRAEGTQQPNRPQSKPSNRPLPPQSSTAQMNRTPIKKADQAPRPQLAVTILNALDSFINTFVDLPRKPSIDPRYVLSDNWAPVDELLPTECEVVKGSLPPSLDGVYIRNGPNPQFLPRGPYHLFDGDGMLHAIRITKGKATLCSRYVQTYKYKLERDTGFPVVPNVFSCFNGGIFAVMARCALIAAIVLAGQFNPANGVGLANTSLALIGGRLFALAESGLPYEIKIDQNGDVHTIGCHDFDRRLSTNMTAHPKIDPKTGEAFAFRYGPVQPFLTFFKISPDGEKQPDVSIFSMTSPSLIHDFAITERYAVFNEIQLEMKPFDMMSGGSPVAMNPRKVPRVGIIPRYAKDESEMRWFEVPGFNSIHMINAWEEDGGDTVVVVAPNILSLQHTLDRMDLLHSSIEKVKIDVKTGAVSRQPISAWNLDFAVVNPAVVGRKNKYVYAGVGDPWPKVSGVVKLDISKSDGECVVASRKFGPGCFAGEPFFVARQAGNLNGDDDDEDDGYVMSYVHNEKTGESEFVVMDARSPNLETVAVVRLPRRVPYGFHGLFIKEDDLGKLRVDANCSY